MKKEIIEVKPLTVNDKLLIKLSNKILSKKKSLCIVQDDYIELRSKKFRVEIEEIKNIKKNFIFDTIETKYEIRCGKIVEEISFEEYTNLRNKAIKYKEVENYQFKEKLLKYISK